MVLVSFAQQDDVNAVWGWHTDAIVFSLILCLHSMHGLRGCTCNYSPSFSLCFNVFFCFLIFVHKRSRYASCECGPALQQRPAHTPEFVQAVVMVCHARHQMQALQMSLPTWSPVRNLTRRKAKVPRGHMVESLRLQMRLSWDQQPKVTRQQPCLQCCVNACNFWAPFQKFSGLVWMGRDIGKGELSPVII